MKSQLYGEEGLTGILQLLLDSTQEMFIIIDKALKIVIFNKEATIFSERYLSKKLQNGTSILDYSEPSRIEYLRSMYDNIFKGNRMKYNLQIADNVIFSITYLPVYENGAVKYVSITSKDVTEQEKARMEIQRSQQLLKRGESIAGLGSWEWDIVTGATYWSDELYRILGLEPGEGDPSKEYGFTFLHPDDVNIAEATLAKSFKSGDPYNIELRLIVKSAVKTILCQGIIIRNSLNRNEKLIGTFLDITAKKQLEDSIIKQEQRFKSLIEHSSDLIMQINEQRIITYASPSLASMMQYELNEVIGVRLGTFAYEPDLEIMMPTYLTMLEQPGVPVILEYRVVRKDGSLLWVEGTLTNLLHIPGVNSVVLNQRDISQRKEAERLLTQLNETLQFRATELFSSNVELEKFAYIASHDLQEPLRMITGFLKLLQNKYSGILDEKGNQFIHFAVDGAERMKKLINDLLEYSRAGSNRGMSWLDMNDIAKGVHKVFLNAIENDDAEIIIGDLPEIYGERTQMIQMMQNLIGNALKYRRKEAVKIIVKGEEKEDYWHFSVEDNGIGIDVNYSEEIFNVFQRLHPQDVYEGTGIGLAICKKIAEAHGGKIWVEPAAGKGSIFYFNLKKDSREKADQIILS